MRPGRPAASPDPCWRGGSPGRSVPVLGPVPDPVLDPDLDPDPGPDLDRVVLVAPGGCAARGLVPVPRVLAPERPGLDLGFPLAS